MKKPKGNINYIGSKPFLWALLVSLSLFSSCTIRKGIQAHFDVPVTKQLNPSKASSQQQHACIYTDTVSGEFVFSKETITGAGLLPAALTNPAHQFVFPFWQQKDVTQGWPLTSKVNSYILFRQMKSWLINNA